MIDTNNPSEVIASVLSYAGGILGQYARKFGQR